VDEGNRLAVDRTQLAGTRTNLALTRSAMASERTLMAWIRTCLAMISFGFTIAKLVPERPSEGLLDTRTFASIMIGVALVALMFAAIQHHHEIRQLRARYPDSVPMSNSMLVATLVACFGLFAFVAVMIGR
jgi:putative membrane protein